nr:asparagine--tRNA ligase, cytoplasmic-like [Penaeus vannamei]
MSPGELYTSEKHGSDETGDGTADRPLKTAMQAMRKAGKEPFPTIYVDAKEEGQKYEVIAKSQLKKLTKLWKDECKKIEARLKKEKEDAEREGEGH